MDYQMGRTKVFLKDTQDVYLEQQREIVLTRKILILQKTIRAWHCRRRFLKIQGSCITIQTIWRSYIERKRFLLMRQGYARLQAMIRSRILTARFNAMRSIIIGVQRYCHGYIVRKWASKRTESVVKIQALVRTMIAQKKYRRQKIEYRKRVEAEEWRKQEEGALKNKINDKKAKQEAERNFRERLARMEEEVTKAEVKDKMMTEQKKREIEEAERLKDEPVSDVKLIDQHFGDVYCTQDNEESPTSFKDLKHRRRELLNGEMDLNALPLPIADDEEDISEYKFSQFASIYFQASNSYTYIRRTLKEPLLQMYH